MLALAACGDPEPSSPLAEPSGQTDARPGEAWLAGMALGAYLDCAREQGVTLLQAHRAGDRPGAAENSIRAINASLADGAVLIEMDVRRTADGVLVLMHDRTVERTTTGAGTVTEMSYSEFSALDLRDVDGARVDENPPTLAAALAVLAGRGVAQLDLKTIEIDTIAAAVEAAGAVDRSVIITLTLDDAIALHQRLPGVMISTPISALADLETLDAAGVDRTRLSAWLGVGPGNPELDAVLAAEGIETSYGDFRAERAGGADYAALAANGAEILSVDDVPAAARTLNAAEASRTLLTTCQAARD